MFGRRLPKWSLGLLAALGCSAPARPAETLPSSEIPGRASTFVLRVVFSVNVVGYRRKTWGRLYINNSTIRWDHGNDKRSTSVEERNGQRWIADHKKRTLAIHELSGPSTLALVLRGNIRVRPSERFPEFSRRRFRVLTILERGSDAFDEVTVIVDRRTSSVIRIAVRDGHTETQINIERTTAADPPPPLSRLVRRGYAVQRNQSLQSFR